MNTVLPTLNPATASVAVCIAWVIATFWLANNAGSKFLPGVFPLKGQTATLVAFVWGFVVGAYVYGFQHQSHWSAYLGYLLAEGVAVGAGATGLFTVTQPVYKAVGSVHTKTTAIATATTARAIHLDATDPVQTHTTT